MANKESLSVRFLYRTLPGRLILKVATKRFVSRLGGAYLDSRLSRGMIRRFIRKNGLDMSDYEPGPYRSFNEFFKRRRIGAVETDEDALISPCDGKLSAYTVREDSTFDIKHATYSLGRLLGDEQMAERYRGGLCLIFRLAPENYHRYIYPVSGALGKPWRIEGRLHCVRPIAYTERPVFTENTRELICIDSERWGRVTQIEVGALLVGKICNVSGHESAVQGVEKGWFEFGGSTIMLLVEKDRLDLAEPFAKALDTTEELPIRQGNVVGKNK